MVGLRDALGEREPKTVALSAARFIRAIEAFEDVGQIFGADSDPLIRDAGHDLSVLAFDGSSHFRAGRGIFQGIIEQRKKEPAQSGRITRDGGIAG
jgi:hypothetical protein